MKTAALVIGLALLALGVACFVPGLGLAPDGMLFGTFPVGTPLAVAFVVTGIVGIMIGLSRRRDLAPPARPQGTHDLRDRY